MFVPLMRRKFAVVHVFSFICSSSVIKFTEKKNIYKYGHVRPIEAGLGIPPEDVTFPAVPRTWSRTGSHHLYLSQARRVSTRILYFTSCTCVWLLALR